MRKITIERTIEGMILARPLKKGDGTVMLNEGGKLTARIITRLTEWECDFIYVEGEPESPDEEVQVIGVNIEKVDLEELMDTIDRRFRFVDSNILMKKIKQGLKEHFLRKYINVCGETGTQESGQ